MILKELFLKVGFDSIRPHLERFEPEHLDSIYAFREAYDLLCRMEPVEIMEPVEGEEKEVRIGWDGGEIEGEEKWIGASLPSGGTDWEGALAGEIVVDDMCICLMKRLPCTACGSLPIGDFHRRKSRKVSNGSSATSQLVPMKSLWTN